MVPLVVQVRYVIKQVVGEVVVCKPPFALMVEADSLVVAVRLVTSADMFQMVALVVA
jgi:hypothetical protein